MGEKKKRAAAMLGYPPGIFAEDPGMVELPTAIAELTKIVVLWNHVGEAGDIDKAADMHRALTQLLLRVAGCDARTAQEARMKSQFLTRDLEGLHFEFDRTASGLIAAALEFESARFRPTGPN